MKAFQVLDIKDFMKKLLIQDTFHHFRVSELSVTTGVTYTIDGLLHKEFYDQEILKALDDSGEKYIEWSDIQPFCLSIIKGKQTPLNFKIVFLLTQASISKLLQQNQLTIKSTEVSGLYLNCLYEKDSLMCITGTALNFFTLDKSLDHAWDEMVRRFLQQHEILFEEM